jgi:DNA topoisomerase-1
MIKSFYKPFHESVEKTLKESERVKGERLLGIDPKTQKNVYVKIGRYGAMAQIGDTQSEEKPTFAGLKKGQSLDSITLEEALSLFDLPRISGKFEDLEMTVAIGRFGPYIRHDGKFYSLTKTDDPYEVSEERCIDIIKSKRITDAAKNEIAQHFPKNLGEYEKNEVVVSIGRFGPYITHNKTNYPVAKSQDLLALTLEEAIEYIQGKKKKSAEKALKEFPENTNVKVLSGRYGAYIKIGKDNYKITGDKDANDLTLADCLKIAEESGKAPKKTTKKADTKSTTKATTKSSAKKTKPKV